MPEYITVKPRAVAPGEPIPFGIDKPKNKEETMSDRKTGRPQEYVYIAVHYRRRYEGSLAEVSKKFSYNPFTVFRGVREAELHGDGIFRPKHAPGLEFLRMRL